jgi:ABC-2 type transport system permease protein
MERVTTTDLLRVLNPLRLAGPIFDKELRIASRRGRTYLLRFGYVGILSVFVLSTWRTAVVVRAAASSSVVQASQMGLAAVSIVGVIVWFQFLVAMLLAAVLLSGAIGDEIRRGSLDALLVTPISSPQIVLGKLFSQLLQLVVLLMVSLPLLAVVRVFGGVPWAQIVSSLCITLTAAIVVGSLSLFLSAANRNAQTVVANTIAWCSVVWVGGPGIFSLLTFVGYVSSSEARAVLYLTNPFIVLADQTRRMFMPGSGPAGLADGWPAHCLIMLVVSAALLLLAMRRVRHVALEAVPGGDETKRPEATGTTIVDRLSHRATRRIKGSPVVWREVNRPFFPRGRRGLAQAILLLVVACCVAASLAFLFFRSRTPPYAICITLAVLLELIFAFNVTVASASALTREKEARALPILLTIPYEDAIIIKHKAIGILRRNLPWLVPVPLLGLLAYLLTGPGDGRTRSLLAIVWFEVGLAGSIMFLIGLGLCLSAYFKTTTPAVVLTFGLFFGSKVFVGLFLGPLSLVSVRAFGPGGTLLTGLILSLAQTAIYGGVGLILGSVAGGAVRPNCQK